MTKVIHGAFKHKMTDGSFGFYGQTVCGKPLAFVGLERVADDPNAVTCKRCRDGRAWQYFYSKWLNK